MDIDLPGRIRNTKLAPSNCLLPLFEAIVNSIHAIDDGARLTGVITVHVQRENTQVAFDNGEAVVSEPVNGFIIEDNGCGFTNRNFKAFCTCDSTIKAPIGGKGIGRLLWLKAFEKAEVQSSYTEDGKSWQRAFQFALTEKGIEDHTVQQSEPTEVHTSVKLLGFRDPYREKCPRVLHTIAKRIIEHCLEYFVLDTCPIIKLHDNQTGDWMELNQVFKSQLLRSDSGTFKLKQHDFVLTHVTIASGIESGHKLHFCAHKRSVISENLASRIPNLQATLKSSDDGPAFVYAGYLSGAYLDETVTPDRTSFYSFDEEPLDFAGDLSWNSLLESSVAQAAHFLSPYIDPIKQAKQERIRKYVQDRAPQYRPLLKHKQDALDAIPPNLPDDKLDVELYKIDQTYEAELRNTYQTILSTVDSGVQDFDEYERQFEAFLEEWNDAGLSKLARHVVHRKATLAFFDSLLGITDSGKYQLEKAIHKLIFPLKKTSDDVRSEQMNLWIIDEKLAYHDYLASDLRFDQMSGVLDSDSSGRPDLVIFNAPAAFVDAGPPFSSIVLIEFKRPARNDYQDDDNPIIQVYDYIREMKAGTRSDRIGRPISVASHSPFYAYIICHLSKTLKNQAENAQLTLTPDSNGYFGYNPILGVYVEIISFDKLIADAKKRNAVLFDKLGLSR